MQADSEQDILFPGREHLMQWARQQFELGVAYYQKYTEDEQEEYLEFAIACFENSLQMYTRKFTPLEWAKVQAERGRAYRERVQGNREENLNQSLFALEQALTVYTFTTAPFEWAALHLQLGLTYRDQIQHKRGKYPTSNCLFRSIPTSLHQ